MFAARDGIGQLIILGLLFVGWVIKEVAENAKRKRARQAPARSRERAPTATEPDRTREPDLVYGDRAIPHLPRSAEPARPVGLQRTPRPARRPAPPPEAFRAGKTTLAQEGPLAVRPGERGLQFEHSGKMSGTTKSLSSRRRSRILRRLHVGADGRTIREKVRIAVLWSEVLGPCRSIRGPHRSPAAERQRRR